MTVVAVIFFPIVLVYQGWSFHVFRARVTPRRHRLTDRPSPGGRTPGLAGHLDVVPPAPCPVLALAQRAVAPAARSSACVPRSSTRPGSSTSTSSTSSRPVSRCVISTVAPFGDLEQVGDERIRGRGVEVLAGLVEDQHGEVREQCARDRQPLALATGDSRAELTDLGVEPAGSVVDQSSSEPGRALHRAARWSRCAAQAAGSRERGVEDVGVLGDDADDPAVLVAAQLGDLDPVQRHRTPLVGEEPQQHRRERRLARAAGANDRHSSTGREVEIDPVERPRAPRGVPRRIPRTLSV